MINTENVLQFHALLLDCLSSNRSIHELVASGSRFLNCSLAVCDNAYTIVSRYPNKKNDQVFSSSNTLEIMKPEMVLSLQQKNVPSLLRSSSHPFYFHNELHQFCEVFCPICIRTQVFGYLYTRLPGTEKPSDEFMTLFPLLAQAVSTELQKNHFLTISPTMKEQSILLHQLSSGNLTDEELALSHLMRTGWKPSSTYRISVLYASDQSAYLTPSLENSFHQLHGILPNSLLCTNGDYIIILSDSSEVSDIQSAYFVHLQHFLYYNHLQLAASNPFSALRDSACALQQAESIRQFMQKRTLTNDSSSQTHIFYFEDVMPFLHSNTSSHHNDIMQHIHPHIRALLYHDQNYHTHWIDTLCAYFTHGRNTTQASKALFIHKTTLFYRLSQIESIIGPFMNNPHLLFLFEYSIRLLSLQHLLPSYPKTECDSLESHSVYKDSLTSPSGT